MSERDPRRAVADTNVLVSALLSPRGAPARFLRAAHEGAFTLITSPYVLDELVAVLARPYVRKVARLGPVEIAEARAAIEAMAKVVEGTHAVTGVLRDEKDHPILACALEGGADWLVTGDRRHLLPLKRFGRIQIVTPAAFLRAMSSW